MARSQLLKDLVGGNVSLENVLLRLKVILSDLGNESILKWINGELQGYDNTSDLPKHRVLKGSPIGTYLVNQRFKYTDSPVPLESLLSLDEVESITTVNVTDSISTVQNILISEKRERFGNIVPTAFCHSISKRNLQIAGMCIEVPSNQIEGIISYVKSKLVEIILELEKQFKNLDELDIKSQVDADSDKKEQVIYNIGQIIYEGSIEIGDKNKIGRSIIGNLFGGGK